jgi:hypothetical protein
MTFTQAIGTERCSFGGFDAIFDWFCLEDIAIPNFV